MMMNDPYKLTRRAGIAMLRISRRDDKGIGSMEATLTTNTCNAYETKAASHDHLNNG